jgi:hypothetical protein
MRIIKEYKIVLMVVVPILILVLLRTIESVHFKPDAKKWAEPSVSRSNIITSEQLSSLSGEKLIINLIDEANTEKYVSDYELSIRTDSILKKTYLKKIRNHNGPVLLFSSDPAVTARIWMILRQLGISQLFILTKDSDNEVSKNQFRPDSII